MGPVMNLVLAVIVLAIVLAQGAQVPAYLDQPPVVGAVLKGSPAEKGGIQREDRLLTIGGEPVPTWREAQQAIGMRPSRDVAITLGIGQHTPGRQRREQAASRKRGGRSQRRPEQ